VAAVHLYFPDPWPKTRHRHRRLFDRPELAQAIHRVLVPGGLVHVATDLPWLHEVLCARLAAAGLVASDVTRPLRPVSKFERKYAAAGTYAATFSRPA
jgi:tRNA (guanine-N7-)-methyltransferase